LLAKLCFTSLPANRFVCQQQRNEIMKLLSYLVNIFLRKFFVLTKLPTASPPVPLPYLSRSTRCALLLPRQTGAEL
jgi:hypothetical protein